MSKPKRTTTSKLVEDMRIISLFPPTIVTYGKEQLREGAERLEELRELLMQCLPHVEASAGAEHMLDGFRKPQHALPIDKLVERIKRALK